MENYKRAQLARGAQFTVIDTNKNSLRVRDAEGRERMIDPAQIKLQAYTHETRSLAIGERVRWTENHRAQRADRPLDAGLRVHNGSGGVVENIAANGSRITVRTDAGEKIELDTQTGQKLDHTYAATSYRAQGMTIDQVLVHHNCESGQHGDRETYVSLTRARDDIVMYTQSIDRAAAQSGVHLDKSAAHDVLEPAQDQRQQPVPQPTRSHEHDHSLDRG